MFCRWIPVLLAISFVWQGEKIHKSETEWREILGEARYRVMREKGTEHAFIGQYTHCEQEGIYHCAACNLPLFDAQDKYKTPVGWPCFQKPIASKNVYYLEDHRLPFKRYEVLCRKCDSHLGHVFNDGPPPKGLRYTVNSIALNLYPFQSNERLP